MLKTPRAWEQCNYLDTCPNGTSEKFIGIYIRVDANEEGY